MFILMEEYIKYVKWVVSEIYAEKINEIKNNPTILFEDATEIEPDKLGETIIFTISCNEKRESINKIYKYSDRLSKYYKIVDISIFKGSDLVNFSDTFLITFFCIKIENFINNDIDYKKVFNKNIIFTEELLNKVKKIIEEEKIYLVKANSINKNGIIKNTNQIYKKEINYLDKYFSKINKNIKINTKQIDNTNITDEVITKKYYVEYIDAIIEKIENKKEQLVEEYNNTKDEYHEILNSQRTLAIINVEEDKTIIEICQKMNFNVIVVGKPKNSSKIMHIENINEVMCICKKRKIIYFIDKICKEKETDNVYCVNISNLENLSIDSILNKLSEKKYILQAFSALDDNNSIKVLTGTFLNFSGTEYYSGGAERYLIDLHMVSKVLGYKLRIYQKAKFDFVRLYNDIEIVGIPSDGRNYEYDWEQDKIILENFKENCIGKSKLNIYSSFMECHGKAIKPSIGISHGVAWDNKKNKYSVKRKNSIIDDKSWIIDSAKSCDKIVSVDTNTANYFQTIDYELGNNTEVVSNYVDLSEFEPKEKAENKNIVILYPRRLYEPRGMYMLLNISEKLIKEYPNIEIHFVGKGFKKDTDAIEEKIKKLGKDKVKMYNKLPHLMHTVYKMADITVIPTLYSEGTSLSCLEAMATENAVIATRIGGLTDLVINNYNGKLIEPNEKSLYEAIKEFMDNKNLREKCQKNARLVAKEFNKENWINRWKEIIKSYAYDKDKKANIEYRKIQIKIPSKDEIDYIILNKFIIEKLLDDYFVFIATDNTEDYEKSYGRLQYINNSDEIYFEFDEKYEYDKDIKKIISIEKE